MVGSRSPSRHIDAATDAATDAAIDAATDAASDVAAGAAPRPARANAAVALRSKGREFVLRRAPVDPTLMRRSHDDVTLYPSSRAAAGVGQRVRRYAV